jgi:4-hydroxy-tetrahydrodipicolinate synthase
LEREIEYVIEEGATGVAALAIASEGYKLTEGERDQITREVVATVAGRVPVVVSADGAGTEVAIERAWRAARLGADALMVLPPYFVKPDQVALYDYYGRIGRAVEIPVIIQDAPQLTGVSMGPGLWARLSAEVPTIRYLKVEGTPQGPTISEAIRQSEGRLGVFCGWGGLGMIDALERGIVGSMPAPNFTRMFAEIQRRFETGDVAGAEETFAKGIPFVLWTMQSVDYSVAAAKEAFRRRGVFTSAYQRQPAARLDDESRGQLDRWLQKEGER